MQFLRFLLYLSLYTVTYWLAPKRFTNYYYFFFLKLVPCIFPSRRLFSPECLCQSQRDSNIFLKSYSLTALWRVVPKRGALSQPLPAARIRSGAARAAVHSVQGASAARERWFPSPQWPQPRREAATNPKEEEKKGSLCPSPFSSISSFCFKFQRNRRCIISPSWNTHTR